jgi:molecular chaperone DnaK
MSGGSTEEINAATDKLTTASHKLAEAMYKASSTAPGAGGPQGAPQDGAGSADSKKKDDVVDAEFVDVDDKK